MRDAQQTLCRSHWTWRQSNGEQMAERIERKNYSTMGGKGQVLRSQRSCHAGRLLPQVRCARARAMGLNDAVSLRRRKPRASRSSESRFEREQVSNRARLLPHGYRRAVIANQGFLA